MKNKIKQPEEPKYDPNDPSFKELVEAIALSTDAHFDYEPDIDEIRVIVG